MRIGDKRGQIWVETVIYTLIGLAIIGLVLAGALPKINQKKDEMIISRSIEAIGNIDDKIYEVSRAVGSRRVINLEVKKGEFVIDNAEDTISWILDSSFAYSEIGVPVRFGNMDVTTTKDGDYEVVLKKGYDLDFVFEGEAGEKRFTVAPTPYLLVVKNNGMNDDGEIVIEFSVA